MTTKQRTFTDKLWDFLCSLKLAVITLILLAVTSIIGTVIEQNKSPQEYIQMYGESQYKLFEALNFTDMYHSLWFIGLLWVFSLNLSCCSIKRFPRVLKTVKEPLLIPSEGHYRSLSNREEIVTSLSAQQVVEKLSAFLGTKFAAPRAISEEGERIHIYAEKMPWARFGVYVTHASILIIFLGAILGNTFGYKAYVNVMEGTAVDKVWPRNGQQPLELGFQVRCDNFEVEFYDGGGRPKEFSSDLVVLENGKEVYKKTIEVNDPLTWNGITFYQSSYGPAGNGVFRMKVTPKGGAPFEVTGQEGEHVSLPNGGSFAITGYAQTYQNFGPAVQMHVNSPDGQHGNPFVVLQSFAGFDAKRGGDYAFDLLGYDQKYYTGLQVAKDPGVEIVWLGCTLMVLGTMAAFFLSHRRIWVTVSSLKGKTAVVVGGSAHRNQPAFELYFDQFREELKQELES